MKIKVRKEQRTEASITAIKKSLRITKTLLMLIALLCTATPVLADDPLAAITSMSDFIFSAIKAIGMILLGFGIVQIGLSLKSHDGQQRANGFLTFFGGVVIAFAKDILDLIMP